MEHTTVNEALLIFLAVVNAVQVAILLYLVGQVTCKVCGLKD